MRAVLLSAALLAFAAGSAAAADVLLGREIFVTNCARCHSLDPEETGKRGPHLRGLFERRYGAVEGFPYRMVWTEADPHWTPEQLDAYLEIHRLSEPGRRADVIEFLRTATTGADVVDPARGEALFNTKCSYCHSLGKGAVPARTKTDGDYEDLSRALKGEPLDSGEPARAEPGPAEKARRAPHLGNLFGRAPGAVSGFPYRFVYKIEGPTWTEEDLDSYIEFHARLESFDRADLIAFLERATR